MDWRGRFTPKKQLISNTKTSSRKPRTRSKNSIFAPAAIIWGESLTNARTSSLFYSAHTHSIVCVCKRGSACRPLYHTPLFVEKLWPEGAEDGRTYRCLKLILGIQLNRPWHLINLHRPLCAWNKSGELSRHCITEIADCAIKKKYFIDW